MNSKFLTDTHAHLCDAQFNEDRVQVLDRAKQSGIGTIVEIADSSEGWEPAKKLSEQSVRENSPVDVYWTCGFHPHYANLYEGFNFDTMKKAASQDRCVAIGEIGLDYFKSKSPKETQIQCFRKTLEVAGELNKPVVIHCRDAQADTLRILRSFYGGTARRDVCTGVIHCFSGDIHFAEGCLDLGFFVGVDGPITYPSAKPLREVVSKIPLEKIVLETDSPYLPPQTMRGKRNESANIVKIAEKMAELFEKSIEDITYTTTQNALRLYRIN